ncbi:MAG: prephenate dehydrogenase/arogenate dehydrogenase family protein [Candidatus Roizmanbacteria bacterium]
MKKVAIVGCGRFGKTLNRLFENDFEVRMFHHTDRPQDIFGFADTVFYCVPIESFERLLKKHVAYIDHHLLVDVLSVKEYPKKMFAKHLKNTTGRALLTHPLFGPDSSKGGFAGLPIVLDRNTSTPEEYTFWKQYFEKNGLNVFEMTAKAHDKMVVNSQGLTHFIGRLVQQMHLHPSPIDTVGAQKLFEIMQQTCHDSWQLFENLQTYNAYTKKMRIRLGVAYDHLYEKLLPKRVRKGTLVCGIQGGKGSFNEEALQQYVQKHNIKKYTIKYLYTTERVLKHLHEGMIDCGLFAIQNAIGGIVQESTYAMAKYRFDILEEFSIQICHYLMKRKDVSLADISSIRAHDQVFRQCKSTLQRRYSSYRQISGEGDYIDTAKAAQGVASGILEKNTAILGPKILAQIYDFDIIDENLQDSQDNLTTFFMVKRRA